MWDETVRSAKDKRNTGNGSSTVEFVLVQVFVDLFGSDKDLLELN